MPQFEQTTSTAPDYRSAILVGAGHAITDRVMDQNLDLPAGQVMGQLLQSGYFEALDTSIYSSLLSGDGAQTTFDLGHDSVAVDSIDVLEGGSAVYDFSISRGTGASGEDQIVFGTAPASGTDNVEVRYQRTSANPAGVLLDAVVTGSSEHPAMPVVVQGAVLRSKLSGVPDSYPVGSLMGGLRLE